VPSLAASFKKGCGFCGFLRDLIATEDTQQEIRKRLGVDFFAWQATVSGFDQYSLQVEK
jgi:hypothetical protein